VNTTGTPAAALVVGGSLSGLMAALGLARLGVDVTVLERSTADRRSGAALGNAEGNLHRLFGPTGLAGAEAQAALDGRPASLQTWQQANDLLQAAASADPRVTILHEVTVADVGQDADSAWARTTTGRTYRADLLLGADGHRSVVRRAVAPRAPSAQYAGYVIWLGIAHESELGSVARWPSSLDILDAGADCLLGYPLDGEDGSREPGGRRLGWAWLDPRRTALLEATGCVRDGEVQHSMRARDVPDDVLGELVREAGRWASPWRDAVRSCLRRRGVTGTPVAEYVPEQLAAGRIAIVGDAAHVSTPMTGRGFTQALDGIEVLVAELADPGTGGVVDALAAYERRCLAPARQLVLSGMSFSRSFALDDPHG
jgi:2-polyprenyl-6-methoxyphenol hydroxylase-like FAD-dependent oxidoreductase